MSRTDSDQQYVIYQVEYQKALKRQINGILDTMEAEQFKTVSEYLTKCYDDGFVGTMYDLQGQGIPLVLPIDQEQLVRAVQLDSKISNGLYSRMGEDVSMLKKHITAQVSRGISTGMSFEQVAQQISFKMVGTYNSPGGSLAKAMRIARTEGHRIQVQAGMDACYKAREKGADVVKQWDATLDSSTRESHQQVDGEIRELDEKFSNGLMFPGDPSGGAAEVVNCRCALLQRARWAVEKVDPNTGEVTEGKYQKWNNETGGFIECTGYEDFKEKYLLSSKTLKSSQNSGTIKSVGSCKDFNGLVQYMKNAFNIDVDKSIKPLELSVVQQPLVGFESMVQTFPELGDYVSSIRTSKSGVMACSGDKITFNPVFFSDKTKLADACQQYGNSGWWVKGVTPESIGVHESAHGVEWVLCKLNPSYSYDWEMVMAYNKCTEAQKIVGQACKNIKKTAYGKGKSNDWLKGQISQYAKDNPSETMAEAFNDVYVNGANANPLSLEIQKLTIDLYQKYKGGVVI